VTYDSLEQSAYGAAPVECFKFVTGMTEFRYTSADAAITADGELYSVAAISRGEIDQSTEADGGSVEITLDRLDPISVLFMAYMPVEPMTVRIIRLHRTNPEFKVPFSGQVAEARYNRNSCVLKCTGPQSALKRSIPRLHYQRQCNWALYSAQCGVNREAFKDTATLSAVSGATITSSTFDARDDGWYEGGWAETGDGQRRTIMKHVGGVLTLIAPFFGISAGATVYAFAGCDRSMAICTSRFNNLDNHFGFPDIKPRNPHEKGVQ
jgi:uncharacterized phage protein (TIGR02218 family)